MGKNNLIQPGIARNGLLMARALDHPIRHKVIELLTQNGEMPVTDIYTHNVFRDRAGKYMEQSQCSQHLRIMRTANLVNTRRDGKQIYYSLNRLVYDPAVRHLELLAELYTDGISEEITSNGNGNSYPFTSIR